MTFVYGIELRSQSVVNATLPLFQSDEMLQLRLEADFKKVFLSNEDKTYFPADLKLIDASGAISNFSLEIRMRGITRRLPEICQFPPLRLRFSPDDTADSPFENQRAIKLVTHCKKNAISEQNTIIEYLIYKAFNILTDSSFKVRAAKINYVYNDSKADSIERFAFFIEREKHLAKRLNGVEIEDVKMHPNRLEPNYTCLMDMFQYMIGNTDYSAYELHNIILVADEEQKLPPIALPYDFDWCGMVEAFYAKPNSMFKTETVDERVYRGFKKPNEIINRNIQHFNSKKSEIYDLINNFELLKKSERKRVLKYLDEFYEIINDDKLVKQEFIDNARVLHN
jgi:hypothetical protein